MHNIEEPLSIKTRYGPDSFAVVTGAANPTGQAFCDKLSREGFKLILVDEPENEATLASLSSKYDAASTFTFDFKTQTT